MGNRGRRNQIDEAESDIEEDRVPGLDRPYDCMDEECQSWSRARWKAYEGYQLGNNGNFRLESQADEDRLDELEVVRQAEEDREAA